MRTVAKPRLSGAVLARAMLAIVVGGWLFWQIGVAGVATLAVRSHDAALLAAMGTPSHPDAGSVLAEAMLAAKRPAEAADLARSVVRHDPTNDRALRVLGLASEQLGRPDQGAAIMNEAAALGWRDTPTQLWTLRYAAINDDASTVIQRADALARRNRMGEITFPLFRAAIGEPHLRAALVTSLAARPMWRGAFFADVRQNLPASAAPGMEALFRELRAKGEPIAPVEWLSYVARLVDLGQYQRARRIWAGAFAIPASRLAAMPYDGDFALAAAKPTDAAIAPFEWRLNPDLAGAVTFGRTAAGTSLEVPGELAGGTTIVSQLLVLAPGSHELSARVTGSAGDAAAGWSIACQPSKLDLPRRLARGADDELTSVAFDVPPSGCDAQLLSLVTRDRIDSQAVSIGDVRVR